MKKNAIVWGMISLFAGIFFFWSCDDNNDDYSLDKYYQSIVTVEGDTAAGSYWLKLTDGDLLWPVNQGWLPVYGTEIGARGLATYNLVGGADGPYANLIRLISISGILTKDILDWTVQNEDTTVLANWNPGVIDDAWIEKSDSTYINIIFSYRAKKSVIHYINLVQDERNSSVVNPTGGVWTLGLCQNSNGDWTEHGNKYRTLVSFYVPSDISLNTLSEINIQYIDWDGQQKTYVLTLNSTKAPSFSQSQVREFAEGIDGMK